MYPIYVTGHRNPDTDSIVSAMAYAALRAALGDREYIPARLGEISDETRLVLEHFNCEPPLHIHNVRTQVRDLDYDTPPTLSAYVTVNHAWSLYQDDDKLTVLPIIDEEGGLIGMLTRGDIASCDMRSIVDPTISEIPIFNLLSSLEGQLLGDAADSIDSVSGEVMIALPQPLKTLMNITERSIVICGEQPDVIEQAIRARARCLVICQAELPERFRSCNDIVIISTPYDAYRAARMIYQAVPIIRICQRNEMVSFHLDDYLDDVREAMLQSRYRSYPILDEKDRVVGTLSRYHLIRPRRKRVVLVDHNESAQSVPGLEQADILGIIDHHRLADVQTGAPVYFRNEPVGSTATIIADMYRERGLMPTQKLAGLMAAAIVSDTVMFKSPTCTPKDRRTAERMARIAGISLDELGHDIFSVSSNENKPARDLLLSDFKEFHIGGHQLGIGQVTCLDSHGMLRRKDEFINAMADLRKERGSDMMLMMLTDVLRDGTELLYICDDDIIRQAFNVSPHDNGVFLPNVMSRKKQVVPALSAMWG